MDADIDPDLFADDIDDDFTAEEWTLDELDRSSDFVALRSQSSRADEFSE